MIDEDVLDLISKTTMHTQSREAAAAFFIERPHQIPKLVNLAQTSNGRLQIMAFAILDEIAESNISLLAPFLNSLLKLFPLVTHQSPVRCCSRIAMFFLARSLTDPNLVSPDEKKILCDQCFDWLISNNRVAAKVNAMYGLSAAAKSDCKIYDMLIPIIENSFAGSSPGYKAAVRKVLREKHHLPKL